MKNVALIGMGPHAKRIYLHHLKKHAVPEYHFHTFSFPETK